MTKYLNFCQFNGDDTYKNRRSNFSIVETGAPKFVVKVDEIGTLEFNELNTVTGTVKNYLNQPQSNVAVEVVVELPRDSIGYFHTTTNAQGVFSIQFRATRHGDYIIRAVASENTQYRSGTSPDVFATTGQIATTTTLTASASELIVNQVVALTATVKDASNNVLKGAKVIVYDENGTELYQGYTNSSGQYVRNIKLSEVTTYKFKAKAASTDLYFESAMTGLVSVRTIKHTLEATLVDDILYDGWSARISVKNESEKVTSNTKFTVTVSDGVNSNSSNIISNENGVVTTNPISSSNNTIHIAISFAGNEQYNALSQTFDISCKPSIKITKVPRTIQNNETSYPYKPWENISSILRKGEDASASAGTNCTSNPLASRAGSRYRPAPLKFSNLDFNIDENSELKSLKIVMSCRTLSCSSDAANVSIASPSVKLFGSSYLMELPTTNGKLPFKKFGDVVKTINLTDLTVSRITSDSFYFIIDFPPNTSSNTGRVQVDYVEATLEYVPHQMEA